MVILFAFAALAAVFVSVIWSEAWKDVTERRCKCSERIAEIESDPGEPRRIGF